MAVTQTQYTGNGNTVLYSFTFPYLATTDVKVKINGVTQATTEYSLANATTVQMNSAPANGATVLIFRDTDNDNKKATFYPGSAIKAEDLNDNIDQILYVAQEVDNNAMSTLGDDAMQGDLSLGNNKITNLGNPSSGTDAVNKTTLDSTIDTAIESDVLVGTDLSKSASGGQITINHNVSGANTTINNSGGNVVQDITISAQGHVTSAGSVNLDNRYYTETELNAGQLDNRYFTETELSGGQLNNLYYTETELDGGQLDNRYFTETELNNGALDNRYFTEAELNNGQLDTRYFRQDSSETITSGATWSGSDNFIATTAAIDARIVDLVDDVGGFVPIANETSFPATNPDVNNGTGTLVSIKSIASARTPSGGSVVITNGAGSGNDVTITGLGTTVLPAGYGVIVETTGTTHTYTFHRLSPDATSVTAVSAIPNEIATVAGISSHVQTVSGINNDVQVVSANNSNVTSVAGSITNVNTAASNLDQIQNFANVYRIVNSDPTTSLNAGDLIFNTTTNKFRVYTGAAWVDAVARQFSDSTDMLFGNSNDLEIKHDGTHSRVHNNTGSLLLETDSNSIQLNKGTSENMLVATIDGSVELFFNGAGKLATKSNGINVTGNVDITGLLSIDDNQQIVFGNSHDLQIKHNGSDSRIINNGSDLYLYTTGDHEVKILADSQNAIICKPDGAVELYHDNEKKLETKSFGVQVTGELYSDGLRVGDNERIRIGDSEDLQLYHDANTSYIKDSGTGNLRLATNVGEFRNAADDENLARFLENGAVELFYDNDKKLETTSYGVAFVREAKFDNNTNAGKDVIWDPANDQMRWTDNTKATFGTGSDLVIDHDGSHSNIHNTGTGNLHIRGNDSDQIKLQAKSGEQSIVCYSDGGVELYFDNNPKFQTTSNGWKSNDNVRGIFGDGGDLEIFHDGNNSLIYEGGTGNLSIQSTAGEIQLSKGGTFEHMVRAIVDGSVKLYHNGTEALTTTADGIQAMTDAGEGSIYIKGGEGGSSALYLHADQGDDNNDQYRIIASDNDSIFHQNYADGNWENNIKATGNSSTTLYYDASPKLSTQSYGAKVESSNFSTFEIRAAANDAVLKLTSNDNDNTDWTIHNDYSESNDLDFRFNNGRKMNLDSSGNLTVTGSVTTGDLNMSNLNAISGNEVDGTKGNWTMQEGESDLFLINRISGKKYKFNLTEIN